MNLRLCKISIYVVFMGYKKNWSHYKVKIMSKSVHCENYFCCHAIKLLLGFSEELILHREYGKGQRLGSGEAEVNGTSRNSAESQVWIPMPAQEVVDGWIDAV